MDSKTYLEAAARSAASLAHWQKISPADLAVGVQQTLMALAQLDAAKKTLFYGKDFNIKSPAQKEEQLEAALFPPLTEPVFLDCLHAALGIASESAEILSLILEMWKNQGSLTPEAKLALAEECGDVEWYLAMLYRRLGLLPEQIRKANIAKLAARFPGRFDSQAAQWRNLAEERAALLAVFASHASTLDNAKTEG